MKKILIPLPVYGFDPTETAIPWKHFSDNKYKVIFATPDGKSAMCDSRMVTGEKLGLWKKILKARLDAVAAYSEMSRSEMFATPITYDAIRDSDYDGLLLPGGHDKAIRPYLESTLLQQAVVSFFRAKKPVAAICHGVVLVARSIDPATQKSILYDYRTTSLLKSQELAAYRLTRWQLKDYYLTYPGNPVETEVRSLLKSEKQFVKGPKPVYRDDFQHMNRGFALRDRNYLSARWPGDVYNLSDEFMRMLEGKEQLIN